MKKIFTLLSTSLFILLSNIAFCQTTELWATNARGGDDNFGRIVSVDPATNTVNEVHKFPSTYSGTQLQRNKNILYNGRLYGVTLQGGKYDNGVLYSYDPVTNSSTKHHDFKIDEGGGMPVKGLTMLNNKMYGIGTSNSLSWPAYGFIFEFDPATNVYTKKYDLTNDVGGSTSTMLSVFNGKLYGITGWYGPGNYGAIFEYDPVANTCVNKVNLTNDATIGRDCFSGLTLYNNKFYGAMRFGGDNGTGVIFEWDPVANIYTKKYNLLADGPRDFTGGFTVDGSLLYAAPNQGPGSMSNYGAIVAFDPATSTLETKVVFDFATGGGSFGDIIKYNGKFYGTNTVGGANSRGAFFEWDPVTNTITARAHATLESGEQPTGTFAEVNGKLYATCLYGPVNSTMVEWDATTHNFTKKFDFGASDGNLIETKVVYHNGLVYGVTALGGLYNRGVLFSKNVNTGAYTILHNFQYSGYYSMHSQLLIYNNKIYGSTNASSSGLGALYEYDIAGNTFTEKTILNNTTGSQINGSMVVVGNLIYGICSVGGTNSGGTIFSWNPATNAYTVHANLSSTKPAGGFTAYGGYLYAVFTNTSSHSNVIKFNPATNTYTLPATFYTSYGQLSSGEFTVLNNKMYISTGSGGPNGYGTIVEYDPAIESLNKIMDFDSGYPESPTATGSIGNGVMLAYNGELWGLTAQGAAYGSGGIFRYNPVTNTFVKVHDMYNVGYSTAYGNGFTVVQRSVLPVQLSNFSVSKHEKTKALIHWQTHSEQNNRGFAIQRSSDGINFSNIGWVDGKNNATLTAYNFIDNHPANGKNFYRLEQQDFDNKKTYSPVKMLEFEKLISIHVYPNPVADMLTVQNEESAKVLLQVTDMQGRLIKQITLPSGKTMVDLHTIPSGSYRYSLQLSNGGLQTGKITKL